MASLLIKTRIYVPRVHRGLVPRPRLGERLNRGTESKLTLVSAPAGFGKTTLLAEWLDVSQHSAAWVSLDQSDNQTASFWSYVFAALQTVESGVGASAISVAAGLRARKAPNFLMAVIPLAPIRPAESDAESLKYRSLTESERRR